jgi:hypothetical protein
MTRARAFFAIAFLAVGIFFAVAFTGSPESVSGLKAPTVWSSAKPQPATEKMVLTTNADSFGTSSVHGRTREGRLIDVYNAETDGRALTLKLWSRASEGGKYYASTIADFCSGINKFVPEAVSGQVSLANVPPDRQLSVMNATAFIQRRCGQFTNAEYEIFSRRSLLNDKQQDDPLVKVVKAFNDGGFNRSPEAHFKSLTAVLDTQDPMVFSDIGINLSLQAGTDGPFIYFDGKNYPMKDSPAIAAAYSLVPCGLGLNCESLDTSLALACASGAKCYNDRYQKIFEEDAAGNKDTYDKILDFEAKIVAAIRNRDINKFIPGNVP